MWCGACRGYSARHGAGGAQGQNVQGIQRFDSQRQNFDISEALEAFATSAAHVRASASAVGWVLTDAEMAEVDRIAL